MKMRGIASRTLQFQAEVMDGPGFGQPVGPPFVEHGEDVHAIADQTDGSNVFFDPTDRPVGASESWVLEAHDSTGLKPDPCPVDVRKTCRVIWTHRTSPVPPNTSTEHNRWATGEVRLCGPWPDLEAHIERYRNSSAFQPNGRNTRGRGTGTWRAYALSGWECVFYVCFLWLGCVNGFSVQSLRLRIRARSNAGFGSGPDPCQGPTPAILGVVSFLL